MHCSSMVSLGFNPRPAFWPGADSHFGRLSMALVVFQSSPGLLAGRYGDCAASHEYVVVVSILARPFGRARTAPPLALKRIRTMFQSSPGLLAGRVRPRWPRSWAGRSCFNPRPAFWPGATPPACQPRARGPCFNPRPAFWPGATMTQEIQSLEDRVSILARPFGRARTVRLARGMVSPTQFQSSPGLLAGRYAGTHRSPGSRRCFNPRPAFWPGATSCHSRRTAKGECFNPRPAFWPGATTSASPSRPTATCFNPRPAFWPGGTTRALPLSYPGGMFQSSPGLLAGRYWPPWPQS